MGEMRAAALGTHVPKCWPLSRLGSRGSTGQAGCLIPAAAVFTSCLCVYIISTDGLSSCSAGAFVLT